MIKVLAHHHKVVSVIKSCKTAEQRENALQWAKDWSKRMHMLYPKTIVCWSELYNSILDSAPERAVSQNI